MRHKPLDAEDFEKFRPDSHAPATLDDEQAGRRPSGDDTSATQQDRPAAGKDGTIGSGGPGKAQRAEARPAKF